MFKVEVTMTKLCVAASVVFLLATGVLADPVVQTTLDDFLLPGSQPGESGNLEHPSKCDNCHGGYDRAVEPAFNWRGSMMAQAARDPLFYACLAVANQDAPESGDLCIRCHSPAGWLEGRSSPTDGSALNNNDREGVQCDFCHKLVKPTEIGVNPYPGDGDYTLSTYPQDQSYLSSIELIPGWSANGMYVADANNAKRGPFVDAVARHQMLYSPFHPEANLCGTCHDVSNPAFSGSGEGYTPNDLGKPAPSFDPQAMFPVERTFSEWKMSEYGNPASTTTCQDCHMKDVTGYGCNKKGAPLRNNLPLHDLTGGNTTIPELVAALYPDEVSIDALDAGVQRARGMLEKSASMSVSHSDLGGQYLVTVTVTNETGHKLPSGYPEGRRLWLNLQAFDEAGNLIQEFGGYDAISAQLDEATTKVYEIKPGVSHRLASITPLEAGPSFHFVINDTVYKDNRIPPRGFTNASFEAIQSPPVGHSYADGQYWDETEFVVQGATAYVTARLYYQATSKEYVEFLRDENTTNDWGDKFYDMWATHGKSAPAAMATIKHGITITIDDEPPTAPTNLVAKTISDTEIDLSWDASTDNVGVKGYYIFRDAVMIGDTSATVYYDKGLTPSTSYVYYVKAYDEAGNLSDRSNVVSAKTRKAKGGGKPNSDGSRYPEYTELSLGVDFDPFNAARHINYTLPQASLVRIEIYNAIGQRVATLAEGWRSPGHHSVDWFTDDVTSGLYFARLSAGGNSLVTKVVLLK
jgi:hypothetical protein